MLSHELLERINVNAMADVKEGAVRDALLAAVTYHFHVNVKVEVEMGGARLHPPNTALSVERRATTLAPEAGGRKFEARDSTC